jgi:hypothetical protein
MTEVGYVLVYDLPSENHNIFAIPSVHTLVRNTRVTSTYLLHSLGVQCTESVILVPRENAHKINTVIETVKQNYMSLWNQVREMGLRIEIDPLIRVISVTGEQLSTFRDLAERRLRERIEEAIVRLERISNEIHEITEEEKRRQIRRRLTVERREWVEIERLARSLGINMGGDFTRVIELIDEALGGL